MSIGFFDHVNAEVICGWVKGKADSLSIYIDDLPRNDLRVNRVFRDDLNISFPAIESEGFEVNVPRDILDGEVHTISIFLGDKELNQSPRKFRFNKDKILFIHLPKTGGSSVLFHLQKDKSSKGVGHIQSFLMDNFSQSGGYGSKSLFNKSKLRKIERENHKNLFLPADLNWIGGHVNPLQAAFIINKYQFKNRVKSYFLQRKLFSNFSFEKEINGFKVVSLVRNPLELLISQLNWFHEINYRGSEFLYSHDVADLSKIAFYISKSDHSVMSMLSQILNLGMLNSQTKMLAPNLLLKQDKKTAISHIKNYYYIGTTECIGEAIKNFTFQENQANIVFSNTTEKKFYKFEDIDRELRDFLWKQMKPDMILYDSVREVFG